MLRWLAKSMAARLGLVSAKGVRQAKSARNVAFRKVTAKWLSFAIFCKGPERDPFPDGWMKAAGAFTGLPRELRTHNKKFATLGSGYLTVAALFALLLESLAGCGEGTAARFAHVA